jgi:hypothetical protein
MWPKDQGPAVVHNPNNPSGPPPLEVLVSRGDKSLDLAASLPLDAEKDAVRITGRVPKGHEALLLFVSARGKVKPLEFRRSPADSYDNIIFPAEEGKLAEFTRGEPGTEFVLLCAAEKPESLQGLQDLITQYLTEVKIDEDSGAMRVSKLPPLPGKTLVWLGRDEPTKQSFDFGANRSDNAASVVDTLDKLRQRLREKPLSVFRGVAYPR